MSIRRFSTDPMSDMMNELNRFMSDPFRSFSNMPVSQSRRDISTGETLLTPRMDIYDAKDSWRIHIDLPGVPKENVTAEMRGGNLHVEGQTSDLKEYEKFKNVLGERNIGKYCRVISLPIDADQSQIKAEFKNGVLEMKIQKKAEPQPKRISVA